MGKVGVYPFFPFHGPRGSLVVRSGPLEKGCAGPERWEPRRAAMAGSQSGSPDPTARAAPRAGGGAGSLVS